jgi:hypothetical protein
MKCLSPLFLKPKLELLKVPCGKCAACLQSRSRDWFFRLKFEFQNSPYSYFSTLTYDDSEVVLASFDDGDIPVLYKPHLFQFLKNFRSRLTRKHEDDVFFFRYFAVGEYGSNTVRPHYHVLIFCSHPIIHEEVLKCWGKGHVHHDSVQHAGALLYCCMDVGNSLPSEVASTFDSLGLQKPFRVMSRNPGIGASYFQDKELVDWHKASITRTTSRVDGSLYRLPRYLKEKIYGEDELRAIGKLGKKFGESAEYKRDIVNPNWMSDLIPDYSHGEYLFRSKQKLKYI